MKPGVMKSIVLLAVMALFSTNVFAGTGSVHHRGGMSAGDSHDGYFLLARGGDGGNGGSGGSGECDGSGDGSDGGNGGNGGNGSDSGNGPGDGTGNDGEGPEDGTGNGSTTGDCTSLEA